MRVGLDGEGTGGCKVTEKEERKQGEGWGRTLIGNKGLPGENLRENVNCEGG